MSSHHSESAVGAHDASAPEGDLFTLYSQGPDGVSVVRTAILIRHVPVRGGLGSFVYTTVASAYASAHERPPPHVIDVASISDVFLGCQSPVLCSGAVAGGAAPIEDHCFTLATNGTTLDLEGPSLEATQQWLKQLSAIINTGGKDIVLADEEGGAHAHDEHEIEDSVISTIRIESHVVVSPPVTDKSQTEGMHWKVSDSPSLRHTEAPSTFTAGGAPPPTRAHDLMTKGAGFPFTFHYSSLAGPQARARVLMTFVSPGPVGGSWDGRPHFLLKTSSPAPRPGNTHICLTQQLAKYGDLNALHMWEARIAIDALSDLYLGVTMGLFKTSPALKGLDSTRCVTLVSDLPPPAINWDLEAESSPMFVDWLGAFNAILQEQDVMPEPANGTNTTTNTTVTAAKVVSAPSSKNLEAMRRGSYFNLYEETNGVVTKKLILLFYNDSPSRPLHFVEQALANDPAIVEANDPALVRSSMFYRYAGEHVPRSTSSVPLVPEATDECVPVFFVSDLLLGKQSPLMAANALSAFAPPQACFSLVLSRPGRLGQGQVVLELGLECVEPERILVWLEGIMEVSNRGGDDETPLLTAIASATPTATDANKPSLHVSTSSQQSEGVSVTAPVSPATLASTPRTGLLATDPMVAQLANGHVFHSWENYSLPQRRKVFLFYHVPSDAESTVADDEKKDQLLTGEEKAATEGFYWNYLDSSKDVASDFTRPVVGDERAFAKNAHRSLTLASLRSVYHGRVADIFRSVSTLKSSALVSLLAEDDLLNLEAESPEALDAFLGALRHVLATSANAKSLIQVGLDEESKGAAATKKDKASAARTTEEEADAAFEVQEWFNVQDAVLPLNLAAKATVSVAPLAVGTSSPTGGAGGTTNSFEALSPRSNDASLLAFAQGQVFSRWSASTTDEPKVERITLFVQQALDDSALFLVWITHAPGANEAATAAQLAQAKTWSRTIKSAASLTTATAHSCLLISALSDLHIGRNLPIFLSPSGAAASLVADECVSLVGDASTTAVHSASASTVSESTELHLVATQGIAQIARTISAVTTLLERDGARLHEPLWSVLRGERESFVDPTVRKLDFSYPLVAAAASVANSGVSAADEALLAPLRSGSNFWAWCYATTSDASNTTRQVVRRPGTLRWEATPAPELGVLTWTPAQPADHDGGCVGPQHLQVSQITDLFCGAEATVFAPTHLVRTAGLTAPPAPRHISDEACFSILSVGPEVHLESAHPPDVLAWVDGLSMLLQSGGRSLTEEPAGAIAPPVAIPVAAAAAVTVATTAAALAPPGALELTPIEEVSARTATTDVDEPVAVINKLAVTTEEVEIAPVVTAVPPTEQKPVLVHIVEPFPTLPAQGDLEGVLRLVVALSALADASQLGSYTETQIEGALASIRDAAAMQAPEEMDGVMAAGAAKVVVQCMRAFPDSEAVQLTGAGACWCLATTAENEVLVVEAGGLDVNRANLSKFPDSAMVLQQVCGAVRNVTVADAHKELFARGGFGNELGVEGAKALVAALATHAPATALAQQASGCIAALAMYGPNKTLLGEAGAIQAVVHAMQVHFGTDDAAVQVHEECAASLRNLAANHAPNKELIASCGGIEAIVASMRTHHSSALNQLHSAGALWNIPANNAANKAAVAACGGIEVLLAALQTHCDDAEVQLEVVGALRNLSTLADNKPRLLAAGVVPVVLATMRRLLDLALLQEQACALIFNLANHVSGDGQASVNTLVEAQAPELVVQVLETHLAAPNVVEEACAAAWILVRQAPGRAWAPQLVASVIDLADRALAMHPQSSGVINFAQGMRAAWSAAAITTTETTKQEAPLLQEHALARVVSPVRVAAERA